jgi:hypothetical protein
MSSELGGGSCFSNGVSAMNIKNEIVKLILGSIEQSG